MGYPKYDPHGDPIPDCNGLFKVHDLKLVSTIGLNQSGTIFGVRDHSAPFLQYLEKQGLVIGKKITIAEIIEFDQSMVLQMETGKVQISRQVANNLLIAL